jgi:hypothetical protein
VFTRILRGARSAAHTRTNWRSAAFVAEYKPKTGRPLCAELEPVITMLAPELSKGSAFYTVNTVPHIDPERVVELLRFQLVERGKPSPPPALAKTTSKPFPLEATTPNSRSRWARSETSALGSGSSAGGQ